jgi:hypothetical protein
MFLLAGCSTQVVPIDPPQDALFCDTMTEPFRYTQEEIDGRTAQGWTKNLAREYRLNLSYDRECVE